LYCYLLSRLGCLLIHGARARYSGRPALRPSGHQLKNADVQIAPGDLVSRSASSPDLYCYFVLRFRCLLIHGARARYSGGTKYLLYFALRAAQKRAFKSDPVGFSPALYLSGHQLKNADIQKQNTPADQSVSRQT